MLPMTAKDGHEYGVTLLEQQILARRYGLTLDAVRQSIVVLRSRMLSGEVAPQKSANKTRKIIESHFESSNAIERQGA